MVTSCVGWWVPWQLPDDEMTTEVRDPPPLAGHGCDDGQQMMVVMVGSSDGCDDRQQWWL